MGDHLVTKAQVEAAKKRYEEMERKLQQQEEKKYLRTSREYCSLKGCDLAALEAQLRSKIEQIKAQKNAPLPEQIPEQQQEEIPEPTAP